MTSIFEQLFFTPTVDNQNYSPSSNQVMMWFNNVTYNNSFSFIDAAPTHHNNIFLQPTYIISALVAIILTLHFTMIARKTNRNKNNSKGAVVPPHVSSWVPILGSAIEMSKGNPLDFMYRHAKKLDSPVFTANIAGKRCAFLTDSRMVPLLSQNRNVPWDRVKFNVRAFTNAVGMTETEGRQLLNSLHNKLHRYMLDPDVITDNVHKAQLRLSAAIQRDLPTKVSNNSSSNDWVCFDLYKTVQEHIFLTTTGVLISPDMAAQPGIIDTFRDLNYGLPLAFGGYPRFLLPKYKAALERFEGMFSNPQFMQNSSDLLKIYYNLDATWNARMKTAIMVLWGSNANSTPGVFWLLYYILKDRKAYESIRREVDRVLGSTPDPDAPLSVSQVDELHETQSAFKEACRMQFAAFTVFDLEDDFVVQPKMKERKKSGKPSKFLLQKGTRIMGYVGVHHDDGAIFENPRQFQWKRFAPDENGEPPQFFDRNGRRLLSPTYEFGAGTHLCPGRRFIRYIACSYVAKLISQFDIRLTEKEMSLPQPDIDRELIGLGLTTPAREVFMEVRPRTKN